MRWFGIKSDVGLIACQNVRFWPHTTMLHYSVGQSKTWKPEVKPSTFIKIKSVISETSLLWPLLTTLCSLCQSLKCLNIKIITMQRCTIVLYLFKVDNHVIYHNSNYSLTRPKITPPGGSVFPHLTQILQALCDSLLCLAGKPHGPACHSRPGLHWKPPAVWRWSSFHCRCLLLDQSHMEREGDGTCPSMKEMGDTRVQVKKYHLIYVLENKKQKSQH